MPHLEMVDSSTLVVLDDDVPLGLAIFAGLTGACEGRGLFIDLEHSFILAFLSAAPPLSSERDVGTLVRRISISLSTMEARGEQK